MHMQRAWSGSLARTHSQRSPDGASPGRETSAAVPVQDETAVEFLAPHNKAGGGSPNGAAGGTGEPGFSTPRAATRLPFATPAGAPLLGSPGSAPRGPLAHLAQGGAVDSPSAPVGGGSHSERK